MTERGLPIVDGAPACPFVAFDDDRDARALAPDHRHRCYAELRPAPRALAHQEAYCLSSAFPVCPTFQDWARREAASTRPQAAEPRHDHEPAPVSSPMPPPDREPRHAPDDSLPPRRNPPRDWAAPPPWKGEGPPPAEDVAAPAFLAGLAADPDRPAPDPRRAADATPAAGSPGNPDRWGGEGRGLAGSAADRLAGGQEYEPAPAARRRDLPPEPDVEPYEAEEDEGWVAAAPEIRVRRTSERAPSRDADGGRGGYRDEPGPRDQVRRREQGAGLFGPAWEQPRRYEAYPSLRTRMGIPNLSRVVLAAAGLLLAALLVFFLGPTLLGIGRDDGGATGGGGGASPSASVAPSASVEPTPTPAPTPQVYYVAQGDTMSKIAKRFGVTLDQLLAANPQIKNPDRISIGDPVNIPVPEPTELPNQLPGEASPSP